MELWLAVVGMFLCCAINHNAANPVEKQLLDNLFSSYDARVRPTKSNNSVLVTVQYWMVSLLDLKEREQQMTTFGWVEMIWKDEYLQWNRSQIDMEYLVVKVNDIWHPDLVIRNSADQIYGDIFDNDLYRTIVYSDGTVFYYTAGKTMTFCQLDLTYFPLDRQSCSIQVDSWTYSESQMMLVNKSGALETSLYHPNEQWDLINTKVEYSHGQFNGDIYSDLKFNIYLRRKPLFFAVNLVIPCTLMSFLVLLVFLLPADADEKVSLSITVLLSFSVFQLLVSGTMPETSDYVPLITIYITFVMILAALSLFCTVLVLMFHHHHCGVEPPAWLQTLVFKVLSKLLCTRIHAENGVASGLEVISSRSQSTRANEEGRNGTSPELSGRMAIYAVNDRPEARDFQVCKMAQKFKNRPAENRTSEQLESGLAQRKRFETTESDTIASAIEFFQRSSAKCRIEEEESHTKQKWTEMARVCDRLFLVIFFVATFTICLLLFGVLPRFEPTNVEPVDIS